MKLFTSVFILIFGVYICEAGYGVNNGYHEQSDVQAPPYMPNYMRNLDYSKSGNPRNYVRYSGTKTAHDGGTKTGYTGTRNGYGGTKNGYAGTKNGYGGTKNGYGGTKNGYGGTKNGYGGNKNTYGESRSWDSSGYGPSYAKFAQNANQAYTAKCEIECKNSGICVDTNTCLCPPNFQGKYCEFEKKPCLANPPLPMNSHMKCTGSESCTITCEEGHRFIDGSTIANIRCMQGQWQPTRADLSSIPDCEPECNPPCLNGGVCLSVNTCQCPADFRGPQCQYSASVCDVRKLSFNGGYSCRGDMEKFSCQLSCPSGSSFSIPRAEEYTCLFSSGVFEPRPIPHCVFDEVIVITPSNHRPREPAPDSLHSNATVPFEHTTHSTGEYHPGNKPVTIVVQDFVPKGGSCLTWAGTHYKTFDGKIYSFQSPCKHILVRDALEHKYTVAVRRPECGRGAERCPSELVIYLEEKMYTLSVSEDGSVMFRSSKRLVPMPAALPGLRVAMPGDSVRVDLDAGLTLQWDTNNFIIVEGSVLLWNKTEGLCGTLDGNPENDMRTKEGEIAPTKTVMIASWQLNKFGDVCDESPTDGSACLLKSDADMKKAMQFCSKVFSKDKFRKCSKVMDVSQLLEVCQWDYCACVTSLSPEECACKTVSVYAKECLRHGVEEMRAWRDFDTCPMSCPAGKVYKSCGAESQRSCARPDAAPQGNDTCVEGCFCPDGMLLESGRCVQKEECPCRVRNKNYPPGAVIPKNCNTCTCQAGEWRCTQAPCGARCGSVGDPHYTTFDGLRYDFMGHCTYTLLQADNVTVDVENVACSGSITEAMNLAPYKGEGKPSCTKAVNLAYGGADIRLKQGGLILVNGKEVTQLPVNVGGIRIRAASSLFIIIQLPIKVDLWWDGNTRVFVDVPPSFSGKTKGLCGTFNLDQKDDFLTPEGDVEQSVLAFANKWKTREFCDDIATTEPEHPCTVNVENKEAAEKYCSYLKSSLFESCHDHVDVLPYYQDCVYDMCACAGDPARCLCPTVGHYADACARAGVRVQWRYGVKECEIACAGGQEYTVCADSCVRTCADVSQSAALGCRPACVEGCACPAGQVLDNNNVCVPVALCTCFHKGMEFKPGYKEVRAGKRERELCTCVGARWECAPATPEQIQQYPPAEDLRSNCSSANNMEFTTCEIAEPLTCKNMHLAQSVISQECRPGCQCRRGYVLDASSRRCVRPAQCPCHHGGRSYPDGHVMREACNTCECKSGKWTCTEQQCAGVCGAWGDSHVTTFDGQHYDFEGVCTYLLAKGTADGKDGFHVEIQNEPCGTTGATCSKSVTLRVGNGGPDEETVSLTKSAPLPDTSNLKRIKLRVAGAYVFLDVVSLGVSLQWDRGLRVYVKVDSMWRSRVKGLCGNFNSDTRDDFQTPSGGGIAETSPLIFADSWKLKPTCPKSHEVTDHCKQRPHRKEWASSTCGNLKRFPFTLCHSEVSPALYIEKCESDACACDSGADCECACAAIAAYAHACSERGVTFKWRSQELCPMQCDEECESYNECVSPCPPETCDNTLQYADLKLICEKDTCVEGCKSNKTCPEGTIYSNSSLKECIPRARCKPTCMVLEDGTEVAEGDVLEEDACHTCRCSKGERVCNGQPCVTEQETSSWPPETTPHDQPLTCKTGWTEWINRGPPEISVNGGSLDNEPLPMSNELTIGSPMCKKDMMTKIECRTVGDHKTPKETGLNVECSLENGLICSETKTKCLDFEIRVYCECANEPFQCLNSTRPSYQHPTDCSQFYECTPEMTNPVPHAVLKACTPGLMYHPVTMVCDWPASVALVRPECGVHETTTSTSTITSTSTTPSTVAPEIETEKPRLMTSTAAPVTTTSRCPPGQVYKDCAFRCDKLCDHFRRALLREEQCLPGQMCVASCVDESVANIKCEFGSLWRDKKTCVPLKDCTCDDDGRIVKPGGVVVEGCQKCQCLDNALHCDFSECTMVPPELPDGPTKPYIVLPTTPVPRTTPETTETTPETTVPTETTLIIKTTVSPPPECKPENYKNLLWEREPLPSSAFTASSVLNNMFEPQYAKLDGPPLDVSAGSWTPLESDSSPYIQVELPQKEPIYGVIMQGSPIFDQYVTSYDVMYGDDGHVFSTVDGPDGKPKKFHGPISPKIPIKQMIEPPIEAKFIRIRPETWHTAPSVRFEVIGCQEFTSTATTPTTPTTPTPPTSPTTPTTPWIKPTIPTTAASTRPTLFTTLPPLECLTPLGLEGALPLSLVETSSNMEGRKLLNMSSERGWTPLYSNPGEWILFNFTSPRNITGIKTAGGPSGWVTAYHIMYSSDLLKFNPLLDRNGVQDLLPGNFEGDHVVVNEFRPAIRAQYLKVLPISWHNNLEMKVEPIGCFEPYPEVEDKQTPVPAVCPTCPGVPSASCACAAPLLYDGESCVTRDQCPCFDGFIAYPVGSSFRGEKCDTCMCKLGGVSSCAPTAPCDCAPSLVPKLTEKCECLCEPCTNNTKICPTSKICLPLEKWCDGLQDCPDDELECTTSSTVTETVVTKVMSTQAYTPPATTLAPPTTTEKPQECPKVECPPGYSVRKVSSHSSHRNPSDTSRPRPRNSYQRYYKGGISKGGYSKKSYSKGGYDSPPSRSNRNQVFTLEKPSFNNNRSQAKQECVQFKCIPKLPPIPPKGSTLPPPVCSAPACPERYSLKLESAPLGTECPQYGCVPAPERPAFCNVTGRTVNTFDGTEYKYDVCYHILARENRFGEWMVVVHKKCDESSCQNQLIVNQDQEVILLKPSLMIEYNNYEYTVEQTSKICFQRNSFDVNRLGDGVSIKSRKYNFTVLYSPDGDVKVGVPESYMRRVDGLCGTYDGDSRNERALPDGRVVSSVEQFARAWAHPALREDACRVRAVPHPRQRRVWDLCKAIAEEPLSQCAKVINLDKWRSICLEKICACADLVINGTKKTEEECRCLLVEKLVAECMAADKNIDVSTWRMEMNCPAECPAPLVHYDCYRKSCEPTCVVGGGGGGGGGGAACPAGDGQCFPGCYCPEGKLRRGDRCVTPDDCLDCTCKGVGTPAKYVTFEGDDLPYLGNCTYLASRDVSDDGKRAYEVYASNGPCEDQSSAVCAKAVHLIHEKNVIHVTKDLNTKKLVTTVNGEIVFNLPLIKKWVQITLVNGQDISILLPEQHVQLTVIQSKMEFSVQVPSYLYGNRTQGLCGVCVGDQDRLVTSDGTVTDDFEMYGKSWQAAPPALSALELPQEQCAEPPAPPAPCTPPPPDANPCYNINDVDRFGACHALVDPAPYLAQCEAALCEAAAPAPACDALQRYAAECREQGVCVQWRAGLCPYTCEAPLVYRPCVDCERTCENYEDLKNNPQKCDKYAVEGCFCPEGKVRVNNTCIEPTKCFPCDANKQHFAGDEWQVDACTHCTCSKLPADSSAHVSCTTQRCAEPACADGEDLLTKPARGACCPDYVCVAKPPDVTCEEPKKLECGFGQVLKKKTKPNGCTEFACECKPADECEKIPTASEVEMLEPGMERLIDSSGCCPRVQMVCRAQACPAPPACAAFHTLRTSDVAGKCCPQHTCELPKDKCVVSLEWEAAPKGGERLRTSPQVVLKDIDAVWLDGPCRSCRCVSVASPSSSSPSPQCSTSECPAVVSTPHFVLEPRPVPFTCCPESVQVACRDGDNIYKAGENWTSPYNPCESYQCVQVEDGKLEKITKVQDCLTDCQIGWEYAPPADGAQCCGRCRAVACVLLGAAHAVGSAWASADSCTNYTCADLNGTLQIQSQNESCPEISESVEKQFVLSEEKVPGRCCLKREPIACRVGNNVYQENQTWTTDDPCKNYTCSREGGQLAHVARVAACDVTCARGWRYVQPPRGVCCGRCEQELCVVGEQLRAVGETWHSADNCTTYLCERLEREVYVTSSRTTCPDVSACAEEFVERDGCCAVCREPPAALSKCVPRALPAADTVGAVRVRLGERGLCRNERALPGLGECRGQCDSGTLYNNQTGQHDGSCWCCTATAYSQLTATLQCADGSTALHRVRTPARCACRKCGDMYDIKSGSPSHRPPYSIEPDEFVIPSIFARSGTPQPAERPQVY